MDVGSRMRDRPRLLERVYTATHQLFQAADPLLKRTGYPRVDRWLRGPERLAKEALFDCQMCGQCVLHSTGMTCPMTCPKNLRNGPCGGVRQNGHCEVKPEMRCVWVEAFERSQKMGRHGADILAIQPPLNRQLQGRSAWINQLEGIDTQTQAGWVAIDTVAIWPAEKA